MTTRPEDPPKEEEVSTPTRVFPVPGCSSKCHCHPCHRSTWRLKPAKMKEKQRKNTVYLPHNIWALRVSFLHLEPEEEGYFWSSFYIPTVLTSRFWVTLSSGWGILTLKNSQLKTKTKETHNWFNGTLNSGVLPQYISWYLLYGTAAHVFCLGFIVEFSRR